MGRRRRASWWFTRSARGSADLILQLSIIREALRAHTAQFSEREIRSSMSVKLGSVRADTRCAICWGTLKKVKVVSPCLHRFCQGCIEEHLRKL
jgi:hypothetical protein